MPKTRFIGRVFPQIAKISLPPRTLSWHDDETYTDIVVELRISDSIINVECCSEIYSSEYNMDLLLIRAVDIARITINTIGFARAMGFTVVFETVVGDDEIARPLMLGDHRFS